MRNSARRTQAAVAGFIAALLLSNGCIGSFNLTRQVYRWNNQVVDKWPREFMFLVLTWVPVYGIATLADAVIFNSIEFWKGTNPVEAPAAKAVQSKRLVRGSSEVILAYTPISPEAELYIEQFQQGEPAGSLHIRRQGGLTVGKDGDGRVVLTAQTLADGGILIRDGSGKQMASYSTDQIERLLGSSR